jgi:hypothetical protein
VPGAVWKPNRSTRCKTMAANDSSAMTVLLRRQRAEGELQTRPRRLRRFLLARLRSFAVWSYSCQCQRRAMALGAIASRGAIEDRS